MNHNKRGTQRHEGAKLWGGLFFFVCILAVNDQPSLPVEHRFTGPATRLPIPAEELSADDPNSLRATLDAMGSTSNLEVATHLGEWVSRGPKNYGGKVFGLAVDPTNENIVYVAYGGQSDSHSTNGTGAGLWRTRNGGKSWQAVIAAEEDPCVLSVDVHPQQPNFVIAGLRSIPLNRHPGDVRLSRNGGATWESIGPVSSEQPPLNAFAVKFDISDPNTVYTATHRGLFKTTNAGGDWVKILDYSGTGFFPDAPSLAMHPTDPNTLLLAVRALGVQRSNDGGNSWTQVDQAMDPNVPITVLAWAQSNPNVVYAERISPHRDSSGHTDQMFTYRSTDAGQSWSPTAIVNHRHQSRYDMSIAVDPSDENHVFLGNTEMHYSTDGSVTYHTVLPPPPHPHVDHLAIAVAPSNPSVVYNGNDGGLWKSTDGGLSWRRADRGVRTTHVSSFAVYPGTGIINLSAADYGAIIYDPSDPQEGGWHNSDCGNEYRSNYANDTDHAYYGGGGTTPLTRIGNATRDCLSIDPAPAESRAGHIPMAFDPTDPNTIYTGLGHIWRSTDNGISWTTIGIEEIFLAGKHINTFEVAPTDGQTLYALSNQNSNLWATHDGGDSWIPVNTTAFLSPRALAVLPTDAYTVYVGTDMGIDARHGLFISQDGGAQFDKLIGFPSNIPINKIIVDRQNTARMFVATGMGVLVTEDGGGSWAQLGSEMPRGIVVDASLVDGTLYASSDQGLWSMALNGSSACEQPVTVLPTRAMMGSSGGTVRIDVSIASSCAWNATSPVSWAQVETYGQASGPALIDVNVQPNCGATRETVLTVAGQQIPLKQFGGSDPVAAGAVITISNAGDCLTSVGSGDVLQMQPCDASDPNQRFQLDAIRPLLYHVITASNKCLDTRKTRLVGTRLRKDTCMGEEEAHQFFEFLQDEAGWRLRGNLAGRTLGPEGHTLMCQQRVGDHLEQQLCSASDAQHFQINRAP